MCETIEEFPEVIDTTVKDPASRTLFDVREPSAQSALLGPDQRLRNETSSLPLHS